MFSDVRSEILPRLEQVLLLDLPLSHQKSVEQLMWKSAFYQVIEVFRQELAEFDDERVRQQLLSVIDSVNSHFSPSPFICTYSVTHSLFHSRLKTFLFLLQDSLHGFPRLFTVISEHICFLLLVFLFLHFLVVSSMR